MCGTQFLEKLSLWWTGECEFCFVLLLAQPLNVLSVFPSYSLLIVEGREKIIQCSSYVGNCN